MTMTTQTTETDGTDPIDAIADLFARSGDGRYGEGVSQRAHALQTAALAQQAGAAAPLIAAALLHDIGHLLYEGGVDAAQQGVDDRHEAVGGAWLARHFGPEVCMPVRMHVVAKRYLCATEPPYAARLSPGSQRSLALQGGPLDAAACRAFEAAAFAADAVALRRWDDDAKVVGLATPDFDHFRPELEAALRGTDRSA